MLRRQTWLLLFICCFVLTFPFKSDAKFDETTLEILLGQKVASDLENQYGVSTDPQLNARLQNIALKIAALAPRKGISYQYKVLNSYEVNACAAPGGFIFVNQGLISITGLSDDELAFLIGHETAHVKEKHGVKQILLGIGFSLLFGKDLDQALSENIPKVMALLYVAGRSRDNERESDAKGFEWAVEAGHDPAGGLAFMRRLETLSEKNPDPFKRLFATHPPTEQRSEYLKDYAIKAATGFTFKADIALAASGKCSKTWAPNDPGWVAAFEADTRRKVTNLDKANKTYSPKNIGQCTWFVTAVREDDIAKVFAGNAHLWFDRFKNANYGFGQIPKVGAIVVWNKNLPYSGGYGHVALVTKINQDSTFTVWDSNWCSTERIGYHLVNNRNYLEGFIYWPNGRTEPEKPEELPEVGAPSQPRDKIEIEKGPKHLGDDETNSKTIWLKEFVLNAADLAGRTKAAIQLRVKGMPRKDPVVYINRQKIGYAVTNTGQWQTFNFPFDPKILQAGNNLIDIETIIADLHLTYDDCEFADVYLLLG